MMRYVHFALSVILLSLLALHVYGADVVTSGPLPAGNFKDLLHLGADYSNDYIGTSDGNADHLADFGGEANQNPLPGLPYSGITGATTNPLVWTPLHDDDGRWEAGADNWTRYWHIYIISPDDRQVRFHQGSDDLGKVWVNGELVLNEASPAECTLVAGLNSVTIMLHENGGAAWIETRITDLNNQAFGDLEYTLQPWASAVLSFDVSDVSNGSAVVTNDRLVKTAFTTVGDPPAGYGVTEDGSEPAVWEPVAPATYTITGDPGEVTLTAWVKDAEGNVNSKQTSIYFEPSAPVVADVEVLNQSETATMVVWTTNVACQSRVAYRNDASIDTYYTDLEKAVGTEHYAVLTGLAVDATYVYKLINNEVEDSDRTFVQTADSPEEIPKSRMSVDVSASGGNYTPEAIIDDLPIYWEPGTPTAWVRLDLGARYRVQKIAIQHEKTYHGFRNIKVYMTDSSSTDQLDWGQPVTEVELPGDTGDPIDVTLLGSGRYLIVYGDSQRYRIGVKEMWVYGENIDPIITDFSVSDPTNGNTAFTTSQMINVSASVTPGWYNITEYGITEEATALIPWLPQMPEIYGLSGEGDKGLFLWVRDSNGNIVSKSTKILYSTQTPIVLKSDVAGQTADSAIVLWETDIPASGKVYYREQNETEPQEWIATDFEPAVSLRHFRIMTGLAIGVTYEYKIENNGVEEPPAVYTHEGETPDILKAEMTATASSTAGSQVASFTVDDVLGSGSYWKAANTPAWLCVDLGATYRVTRVSYKGLKDNHSYHNYEIFITDSEVRQDPSLGAPAEWGEPVATGAFPFEVTRQDIDVYGTGRYVIILGDGHQIGIYVEEAWFKGTALDPIITDFVVSDQDTGSTTFTNLPLVDVSASVTPGQAPITGYAITTEEVEPTSWEAELPEWTGLPIANGNVDLWLWVQDADGKTANRQASIAFSSEVPTVSDVVILGQKETTAIVAWNTDVPAVGRVGWREQGATEYAYTELETALGTRHLHELTGLTLGITYEVVLENNEVSGFTVYTYTHDGTVPEIPKSVMDADASNEQSPAERVIDGIDDASHAWMAWPYPSPNKAWLRIDLGVPYQVQMLGITGQKISEMFKDWEIYMTNSDSTDPADWGEPLAAGTFPDGSYQEVNLLGNARYFIIIGDGYVRTAVAELWLYGQRIDPAITEFTITDLDAGTADLTDSQTVGISLAALPLEGVPITGYMVTESDVAPDASDPNWLISEPAQYTFAANVGDEVTLYAWVLDEKGNVIGASDSITYVAGAAITDLAAAEVDATTANVTWTTDIEADGIVRYKLMNGENWTTIEESAAARTSHSVRLSELIEGENYMIIVISNGSVSDAIAYPEANVTWPIAGDANMDCKVNIIDLIFVRNRLNKDVTTGDNWQADVNNDGKVNIIDLIYVRNRLNDRCE